jgi:hypothetical protein
MGGALMDGTRASIKGLERLDSLQTSNLQTFLLGLPSFPKHEK